MIRKLILIATVALPYALYPNDRDIAIERKILGNIYVDTLAFNADGDSVFAIDYHGNIHHFAMNDLNEIIIYKRDKIPPIVPVNVYSQLHIYLGFMDYPVFKNYEEYLHYTEPIKPVSTKITPGVVINVNPYRNILGQKEKDKIPVNIYAGFISGIPNGILGMALFVEETGYPYFSVKTNGKGYDFDFSKDLSESWGDEFIRTENRYTYFNIGTVIKTVNSLFVIPAVGIVSKREINVYYDSSHILSDDGYYNLKGPVKILLNLFLGITWKDDIFFPEKDVRLIFGYDYAPGSFNIGIAFN